MIKVFLRITVLFNLFFFYWGGGILSLFIWEYDGGGGGHSASPFIDRHDLNNPTFTLDST